MITLCMPSLAIMWHVTADLHKLDHSTAHHTTPHQTMENLSKHTSPTSCSPPEQKVQPNTTN
jgi:hypothetical protein